MKTRVVIAEVCEMSVHKSSPVRKIYADTDKKVVNSLTKTSFASHLKIILHLK